MLESLFLTMVTDSNKEIPKLEQHLDHKMVLTQETTQEEVT